MNVHQSLSRIDALPAEHVWGMALFGFMQSVESITELAKAEPYRSFATDDFTKIAEATLAVNLMWSHLQARKVA